MDRLLPAEIVLHIYGFDGRDRENYTNCIRELNHATSDRKICYSMMGNDRQVRHHVRAWLSRNREFYQFILLRNLAKRRLSASI